MNRLLLVDDEEGIRKVLGLSLTDEGYEVQTAENGIKALELFEGSQYLLVITDIKMPGMDGIRLLQEIKRRNPMTEVIIITGHGEMDLAIEALKLEASDFITKPINAEALSVALQRAKEKIQIKKKLLEYTENLERKVYEKTAEITRMYEFRTNLIENAQEGIFAVDTKGNTLVFNRYMEELTGYKREEVTKAKIIEHLFPPEFMSEFYRRIAEITNNRERTVYQPGETLMCSRSKEPIPVQVGAIPLYESGVYDGVLINIHDLRQIKNLQQELIQSERLAAVGQTVAGLAHAIKNILGGLKGGIYVVDQGIELENTTYLIQGWDMVKRNIDKIKNMAMDLLDYAKERELDYKMHSPNEVAKEVFHLLKPQAEEYGISLMKKWDNSLPDVIMDPDAIHTCLANVVTNALDACADLRAGSRNKKVLIETARDVAGNVMYRISDNGCGMDQETMNQLFTRFFSTKGTKGTGLGMMITQKLIHQHGGKIHVASDEGKGTTVVISIPRRRQNQSVE
jgi:two-component system, NtrC family, sensor kinase